MKIVGLQKTSLLDYPGLLCATVFTGGCNFSCPFCHNSELCLADCENAYTDTEIIDFLKKRSNVLDGVTITGGEPTLWPDLPDFLHRIRSISIRIKLDTNGYRPDVLKDLVNRSLVDYVAMDIKSSRETYGSVSGVKDINLDLIEESIDFLKTGMISCEFRTTVTDEYHTPKVMEDIGKWIKGPTAYYLQNFVQNDAVPDKGLHPCSDDKLKNFISILKNYTPNVHIRGSDI